MGENLGRCCGQARSKPELTLMANTSVMVMDPKYAAVKGSRGPEMRCCAYTSGPIKTAQEAKNRIEPMDHLERREASVSHTIGFADWVVGATSPGCLTQLLHRLPPAGAQASSSSSWLLGNGRGSERCVWRISC